ncbi:hypothetical protein CDFC105_43962 [Clostridioides difficile]|nr:hypothetical protein CDFC105_43962 [Clostridioides difficile]
MYGDCELKIDCNMEKEVLSGKNIVLLTEKLHICLLYTSDAADDSLRLVLRGLRYTSEKADESLQLILSVYHNSIQT